MTDDGTYSLRDGICTPPEAVIHREEEYDSHAGMLLRDMQQGHFWYQGRHRFLLHAVQRHLAPRAGPTRVKSMIDLGGGCGGWVRYMLQRARFAVAEAAVGDSSLTALQAARAGLPPDVRCYLLDLLQLPWENRWDAAFLLDVLEHLPREEEALRQIQRALKPGGYLFLTTPALPFFWSWLDEATGHQRRYTRRDYQRLASACGFELLEARHFMFFLSPLYFVSRLRPGRKIAGQPRPMVREWVARACRPPPTALNALLRVILECETPLGHLVPFPWGTSLLGVLRKKS